MKRSPWTRRAPTAIAIAASILVLAGCGVIGAASASTPGITATLGPRSQLPANYFGINYNYLAAAQFPDDLNQGTQLGALDPGTIRYPGGVEANSFQWQAGVPDTIRNNYHFTLQELDNAWMKTGPTPQTRALPIFDINIVTRPLSDQITMLQTAQSMGMPIRYVELGNELYSKTFFADGTAYGATVATDVKQLHETFSGVKVGADAWLGHLDGPPPTPVERTWNQEMLAAAAQHGGSPDAVILHAYPPPPSGDLTTTNLPNLFENSYREAQLVRTVIDGLPSPAPPAAWLTEYNVHAGKPGLSNPPQGSYAHGLFVGEHALLLQRSPMATLSDLFTSFGGSDFGSWQGSSSNPKLSPPGLAFQWVAEAAKDATGTASIVFNGGPVLSDGNPALVGQVFTAGGTTRAAILNLTGQKLTVGVGSALPAGAPFDDVTGNPVAQVTDAGKLTHGTGTVGTTITLQPYSITRVG